MALSKDISLSLEQLYHFIVESDYSGYDQYDVLLSPLFNLPLFKSSKIIRFGSQQVYRRLPINTRKLLRIRKGINPVTLGLSIQAFSYLTKVFPEKSEQFISEIEKLKKLLYKYQSKGYKGISWGYNFDWEARYTSIKAFVPTSVATGIITNGLFENYRITGDNESLEMCIKSADFILHDLYKSYEGDNFCFSYSPVDKQFVFNASMKAARLLSQVYSVTGDEALKEDVFRAVKYVVDNQRSNGAWGYANHDARIWVDNYHTGYILDCLDEIIKLTGYNEFNQNLKLGFDYYIDNFFYENQLPKFRNNKIYPIDSTGIGQSLLTLSRFKKFELSKNVALWAINNMQDSKGYFYFRKYKYFKNKIPYMRWSNAWLFTGLSYFLYQSIKQINNN